MTIIEDGTGTGRKARVDTLNALRTSSTTTSEESFTSQVLEQCYQSTFATPIVNPNGPIMYLKNTSSTKNLLILKVMVSSSADGTCVKFYKNPTGTPATTTTMNAVNLNFGSPEEADSELYTTSGTSITGLTLSDTNLLAHFPFIKSGFQLFPVDDTFVLDKGNSFCASLNVTGSTTMAIRYIFLDKRTG